jgi:hypothetical protein
MRLIDVKTLQLFEFFGGTISPYAILSHRWGHEQLGIDIFMNPIMEAKKLKGFKKILYCVDQANADGIAWCWVDTCCIDKRSSSELLEAINSMYRWYKSAVYGYAHLEDISVPDGMLEETFLNGCKKQMFRSEWFTRG